MSVSVVQTGMEKFIARREIFQINESISYKKYNTKQNIS